MNYLQTILHIAKQQGYVWEDHKDIYTNSLSNKIMVCFKGEHIYNASNAVDLAKFLADEVDKDLKIFDVFNDVELAQIKLSQAQHNLNNYLTTV